MAILSISILGLVYATTAGHQHLDQADTESRAIRLAEHLLEEIHSRPYAGSGAERATWHVDDFDGFQEEPGDLKDFTAELYAPEYQVYTRTASVSSASHTLTDLDGLVVPGKTILVVLRHIDGREWNLSRFIPEPLSP